MKTAYRRPPRLRRLAWRSVVGQGVGHSAAGDGGGAAERVKRVGQGEGGVGVAEDGVPSSGGWVSPSLIAGCYAHGKSREEYVVLRD